MIGAHFPWDGCLRVLLASRRAGDHAAALLNTGHDIVSAVAIEELCSIIWKVGARLFVGTFIPQEAGVGLVEGWCEKTKPPCLAAFPPSLFVYGQDYFGAIAINAGCRSEQVGKFKGVNDPPPHLFWCTRLMGGASGSCSADRGKVCVLKDVFLSNSKACGVEQGTCNISGVVIKQSS